jgi:hypothetical protein
LFCEAGVRPNDRFGKNHFNRMIGSLAVECKFDNADRYTMRSVRRFMLTKMNVNQVSNVTKRVSGRHKSDDANVLYQDSNDDVYAERNEALMFKPAKKAKRAPTTESSTSTVMVSTAPTAQVSAPNMYGAPSMAQGPLYNAFGQLVYPGVQPQVMPQFMGMGGFPQYGTFGQPAFGHQSFTPMGMPVQPFGNSFLQQQQQAVFMGQHAVQASTLQPQQQAMSLASTANVATTATTHPTYSATAKDESSDDSSSSEDDSSVSD